MGEQNNVVDTLRERGGQHGDYSEQARCSQRLKVYLREQSGWAKLTFRQQDALEHITTKISRILCGNAEEADHWLDLAGYANLGGGWKP